MEAQRAVQRNDQERVAVLEKYAILDTEPEQAFDDLTLLASFICKTPIAMISLIDEDRQWLKSKAGIKGSKRPRHVFFCSITIQQGDGMVVPDPLKDERFCTNPFVTGGPKIRFY